MVNHVEELPADSDEMAKFTAPSARFGMLTDRFAEALTYAERLHRSQKRKGNDIPYVAHLLAVCATVLEWGGDEDTAVAGLLHDAVEDQGGLETLAENSGTLRSDLIASTHSNGRS
jgi:(p)ppGpp synthase/HD superfamily hydrolase